MMVWVLFLGLLVFLFLQPREHLELRGPDFKGKGPEPVVETDTYKTNKYPELLGGRGDLTTRIEGAGIVEPSKNWRLAVDGSLPDYASLGCEENSIYLPFARKPTELETVVDAYKVSRQSFPSVKTEPSPFLTDFSAF